MSSVDLGSQFALDVQGLQRLKRSAREAPQGAALDEASRQFEALFLQMMLKSMREASTEGGLLDSQQTRMFTQMLDQQWAQQLAGKGLGLAEQLSQQIRVQQGMSQALSASADDALIAGIPRGTPRPLYGALQTEATKRPATQGEFAARVAESATQRVERLVPSASSLAAVRAASSDEQRAGHVESFVARLQQPARAAEQASGVPAELILAQAALETGWGRFEIATASGGNSHNLFGIKAGSSWSGPTTEVRTTEYVDGQPQSRVERFRVYPSFEAAFTDYARLIGDNPRYAAVVDAPDARSAARALQAGGYATDPAYADKLIAVMDTLAPFDPARQLAGL